jgi:hypothetical protein
MESSGGHLCGLAILSAFFTLSLGAAVAGNPPVSLGTNIGKIISVNYLGADQWVEMVNKGTGSMDLTGWTLINMENQTYAFPANFTLKAGLQVRVHSGKGDNTSFDLFNSTLLWSEMGDTATLKDATGKIVSEYKYPVDVSAAGAVAKIEPLPLPNAFSSGGMTPPFLPDYRPPYSAERGGLKSSFPVNLTGHAFICHGGPLNWAWTSGLK